MLVKWSKDDHVSSRKEASYWNSAPCLCGSFAGEGIMHFICHVTSYNLTLISQVSISIVIEWKYNGFKVPRDLS